MFTIIQQESIKITPKPMQQQKQLKQPRCTTRTAAGIVGCFGGMFIHLVIGSLYQWGIINLYITSYFKAQDSTATLENNAIAFPIMMLTIGVTMRLGLFVSEHTHPLLVMGSVVTCQALLIFCCSYVTSMGAFIVLYAALFGLASGLSFMVPIVQCNKYFPGKKMYVNGVVLTGTGLGSVVFGLFSYNFLNPKKLPPIEGYYIGTTQLQVIAGKVPQCLRWLALFYLVIGMLGVIFMGKVCIDNRQEANRQKEEKKKMQQNKAPMKDVQIKEQNLSKYEINLKSPKANQSNLSIKQTNSYNELIAKNDQNNGEINEENINEDDVPKLEMDVPVQTHAHGIVYPTQIWEGFRTRVCWIKVGIMFFGSCGVFLMTGNYKTYVKNTISNDEMLTVVGVVGSIGNGISRFFWALLFNHTGYRFSLVLNLSIQIIVFATLRFTVYEAGVYLFLMFLNGCCMGGFFVLSPTFIQIVFGEVVGSNIYGFFWQIFGLANLVQYAYVSGLSLKITFNGVIYICLGMAAFSMLLGIFGNFDTPWRHPNDQLGYCRDCNKEQKQK